MLLIANYVVKVKTTSSLLQDHFFLNIPHDTIADSDDGILLRRPDRDYWGIDSHTKMTELIVEPLSLY